MALMAVPSCKMMRPSTTGRDTIPYVKKLLSDSLTSRYGLVRSYDPSSSKGTIAIVGDPESCLMLSEEFLACDRFDNISGSSRNDLLPDFAGEVIALYMDEAGAPYQVYLPDMVDSLREVAVRNSLYALDTVCLLTPFNVESVISKDRAKVLILSSSLMSEHGYFDVDTLISTSGKKIPLLSPVHAMLDEVFASSAGSCNIAVWTDSLTIEADPFGSVFKNDYRTKVAEGSTLNCVTPKQEGDLVKRFYSFLDKWNQKGNPLPISAVLLDDYGVNTFILRKELAKIRKEETTEMLRYSKMLSKDVRFIDVVGALTSECYLTLRRTNRFTHNIAYPKAALYQTVPNLDGSRLILTDERYISSSTKEFMEENSPYTMQFYVQR